MPTQQDKATAFHQLHHSGEILLLPNIWDPLGALLLEDLKYPAVATASASIAYANGYNDGENIPFVQLISILKSIAGRVSVPVSADIESGYASDNKQLAENIRQIIDAGVVGINLEDTDAKTDFLLPTGLQCRKIECIRNTSEKMNVRLFINARTDVFISGIFTGDMEEKIAEAISRARQFKSAGADGFYPILLNDKDAIQKIVEEVEMPVNIIMMPGIPELKVLQEMGVARVTLGPGFFKIAVKAMKDIASKLQNRQGVDEVISNDITSDYLKKLAGKNQ